eukprot:scaffold1872_cov262-Amphora_coffeaeformis.AAC.11
MRFDNSARMQQLDGILKPKSKKCKASSGRSISSASKNSKTGDEESRASSRASSGRSSILKGKHTKDVLSDASTARTNTASTSASRSSVCSRDSLQSRSTTGSRGEGPIGCKQVVLLQESWDMLKASQINETDIGENILYRLIETKAWTESNSFSTMTHFHVDRIDYFAKLFVETIDNIIALAGPNLFDEDFESLRLVWIDEGLHPALVSRVLLDGLEDSTTQDIFSDNVLQAWLSTVVELLRSWEADH